jgi:hypothetical protein
MQSDDEINRNVPELAAKLGLLRETPGQAEAPYFTGWKYAPHEPSRYVGQLVYWFKPQEGKPNQGVVVNLPGMEVGMYDEGALVDVGTERLTETPTTEAMEEMLLTGLAKLREFIESYRKVREP